MRSTRAANAILALSVVALYACGGGDNPMVTPTPTPPTTSTTTQPTPKPTGVVLPAGMKCDPSPPPLWRYDVQIWSGTCAPGQGCLLDTKPVVKNVDDYCGRVGFGSAYRHCETRPEGDPQRQACDYSLVGQTKDGKWGPTWYGDGRPCDGTALTNCNLVAAEQFKLKVKGPGEFLACVADNVPLSPDAELAGPNGRCGIINID